MSACDSTGRSPERAAAWHRGRFYARSQCFPHALEGTATYTPAESNIAAGGTHTVRGEAQVQAPAEGRGKAMTQVTAVIDIAG